MASLTFILGLILGILWAKFYLRPSGRHTSWTPGVFSLAWLMGSIVLVFGGYLGMAL